MTIYQGLKIIDQAKLPHPEWQFVRTSKDIKNLNKVKDYCGWTIRTAKVDGAPWQNLYVNWLPKKKVSVKVDELQAQHPGRAMFVIYPSWEWKKGGTILVEKERVVIKATRGEIVNLMRYGKISASYVFQKGKLVEVNGDKNFLSVSEIKKVIQAQERIKKKNVILEWGITTQNKFIFYRIEDLKEAAKLLIEKYS